MSGISQCAQCVALLDSIDEAVEYTDWLVAAAHG